MILIKEVNLTMKNNVTYINSPNAGVKVQIFKVSRKYIAYVFKNEELEYVEDFTAEPNFAEIIYKWYVGQREIFNMFSK